VKRTGIIGGSVVLAGDWGAPRAGVAATATLAALPASTPRRDTPGSKKSNMDLRSL
jgi:hypothetical protein